MGGGALPLPFDMLKLANCHLKAWERFVKERGYLILRRTTHHTWEQEIPAWYVPISWLGILFQHLGSWIVFIGWVVRWRGGFYHVSWAKHIDGDWWEWVPNAKQMKFLKYFPFFKGHWRRVVVREHTDDGAE